MKLRILLRKVHHWGAIVIALPLLIVIGAGLLLMLKKEVSWIQPATISGVSSQMPQLAISDLFAAAQSAEKAGLRDWADLDRVDIKPSKGVIKFVGENRWEVQVDTMTGEVLQVAFRRSDLIESLHDGSFFSSWTKLYLFLPSGAILFVLWGTGLYLFFLPHVKNYQKRRAKQQIIASSVRKDSGQG